MTARFPWPQYLRPLELDVVAVHLDGLDADVADSGQARVHLDSVESDWAEIELGLDLSTSDSRPPALEGIPLTAHAVLSSGSTNSRIPAVLHEVEDGHWQGLLRARRAELGGVMTLEARLTAPDDTGRPLLRGTSTSWSVVLEAGAAPTSPARTPVTSKWVDFASAEAPPVCRAYSSAPFAVTLEGATPVLYLNSGEKHFQKLLLNEHAQKERRRLRDTFSTLIAATLTRTLVQAAVEDLVLNSQGEEAVPPQDPVLRQSCEAVAEVMRSVTDVHELYTRMWTAQGSAAQLRDLWTELDLAIGELVSLNQNIVTFAEEVR
ncbi:hypothetical protein ACI8AF_22675 [Blastococcus sp. SYSU D00669]